MNKISPPAYLLILLCLIYSPLIYRLKTSTSERTAQEARLPAPSGPWAVGSFNHRIVDEGRDDPFVRQHKREIPLRLWYPIENNIEGKRAEWMPEAQDWIAAFKDLALRELQLDKTQVDLDDILPYLRDLVRTNSIENAPLSRRGKPFPVILVPSPTNAISRMYTSLFEDLASHGFVVVAIDNVGVCGYSRLSDGTAVSFSPGSGVDLNLEIIKDIRGVLRWLGRYNLQGASRGALDLANVGVLGHSLGGSVAGESSLSFKAVRASVNIDGAYGPGARGKGLYKPHMLLSSSTSKVPPGSLPISMHADWYSIALRGTNHWSFSDIPLLTRTLNPALLTKEVDRGMAKPYDVLRVEKSIIRAFFSVYLQAKDKGQLQRAIWENREALSNQVASTLIDLPSHLTPLVLLLLVLVGLLELEVLHTSLFLKFLFGGIGIGLILTLFCDVSVPYIPYSPLVVYLALSGKIIALTFPQLALTLLPLILAALYLQRRRLIILATNPMMMITCIFLIGMIVFTFFSCSWHPLWDRNNELGARLWLAGAGVAVLHLWPIRLVRSVDSFCFASCSLVWAQILKIPTSAFLFITSTSLFLVCITVSIVAFDGFPWTGSSVAQLFHAKILAQGKLYTTAPIYPEFFNLSLAIIEKGHWYSQFFLGHTALLAITYLLDAPFLLNPILGAASVYTLYQIGAMVFGDKTARVSVLLAITSPFYLLMHAEFMNHASSLFFFELFLFQLILAFKRRHSLNAALAGLALGWMFNVRPLTAVGLSAPFVIFFSFERVRRCRSYFSAYIAFGLSLCIGLGVFLLFNYLTNGQWFLTGYEAKWGATHGMGFGSRGLAYHESFTPERGLLNVLNDLAQLNIILFGWALPGLVLPLAGFITFRRFMSKWPLLFLSAATSLFFCHFIYWRYDTYMGPRFIFESLPLLFLLSGYFLYRGARALKRMRHHTVGMLLLFFSFTPILTLPWLFSKHVDAGYGPNKQVARSVKSAGIHNSLVFVRGEKLDYLARNDPDLKGDIIYAIDLGSANNSRLIRYFSDRTPYLSAGDFLFRLRK